MRTCIITMIGPASLAGKLGRNCPCHCPCRLPLLWLSYGRRQRGRNQSLRQYAAAGSAACASAETWSRRLWGAGTCTAVTACLVWLSAQSAGSPLRRSGCTAEHAVQCTSCSTCSHGCTPAQSECSLANNRRRAAAHSVAIACVRVHVLPTVLRPHFATSSCRIGRI